MKKSSAKIRVKRSGFVRLQHFDDGKDGMLTIGESKRSVPFSIKRIYYINRLGRKRAVRGKHAHRKLEQIIFCINGSFRLDLDDGEKAQSISMTDPYVGVRLGSMLWHEMTDFSKDCVMLVLADDYYKKGDYVRDYGEFHRLVKKIK